MRGDRGGFRREVGRAGKGCLRNRTRPYPDLPQRPPCRCSSSGITQETQRVLCPALNLWGSVRHRSGTPHSMLVLSGRLSRGLSATPPKVRREAKRRPACRVSRMAAPLATRWCAK